MEEDAIEDILERMNVWDWTSVNTKQASLYMVYEIYGRVEILHVLNCQGI